MGYYTRFSGQFTFSRALNFIELSDIEPSLPDYLRFVKETSEKTLPEGLLTVTLATGLRVHGEEVKAYNFERDVEEIFSLLPVDVEISGEIRGEGEDSMDVRRYVIAFPNGSKLQELRPKLVWPDGKEEESER